MQTNQGPIALELFDEDAPKTVANFKKLAGEGFYDGLIFHRVIKDFMIQGGCPQGTGTGGPGYTFEDEFNDHKIVRGALAMANAGPNTNGSQFFLVTTDAAPWLDGKHTVFGRVTDGMDVVDKIEGTDTDGARPSRRGHAHRVGHVGVGSLAAQPVFSVERSPMAGTEEKVAPEATTTNGHQAGQVPVENPATGEVVAHVPDLSAEQVREMAKRARAAQPGWEALGFAGRARVMLRMQKWLLDNADARHRDDRQGDRQVLGGRAARRDLLRRQRVRLLGQERREVPRRRAASSPAPCSSRARS